MIKIFPSGLLDTNTYAVWDETTRVGMVIDCGVKPALVKDYVKDMGITVKYVVLTHGHFDHAEYVEEYAAEFPSAQLICHRDERAVLYDTEANLSFWGGRPRAYDCNYTYVEEGDILSLSNKENTEKSGEECMNFTVLHTPGHTPGGICLYCERDKIMFTGDTLFRHSYGRTDFKYGDTKKLMESLKRLYAMDKDITFYPGHYGSSTIGDEIY